MNTSILMAARRFMTGDELFFGGDVCVSCGLPRANTPVAKGMNSTFNCFGLFLTDSRVICPQCMELFKDRAGRSKIMYYTEKGEQRIIAREDVLPILKAPPAGEFVLSLPYSFQKHHWIHAGLSTPYRAYIGTDDGTVVFDYERHDISRLVDIAVDAVMYGLSRKELTAGKYSVFTRARFGAELDAWEAELAPLRHGGALDLIVRHIPAVKKKKSFILQEEEGAVFSDTEQKAIAILSTLAVSSRYRKENGLQFWQAFFRRRIMRNVDYPLNQFFSNVARGIFCETAMLDVSLIESMSEEDSRAVMREIKQKTDLLLASTYTAIKEANESAENKKKTEKPSPKTKTDTVKKEKTNGLQATLF